ncbi:DUF1016 N-terminal domain-containing protein [Prevotella sp. AGR2160]|uniref:DUF1016 N-terminal domain-containing protein n=1 Tax=Prevotella sp. AGR2160 TaxID=1280674 RepID=UPI0009DC0D77|nr:DUF1016 N-terminal domain-containing protein [Prevotella sp. AGR2160]
MEDNRSIASSNIKELVDEIRAIIDQARHHAARSIDHTRVLMYWNIGKRIFEREQQGKERADYGSYLLDTLSRDLTPVYGSGVSVRQLEMCRKFYRTYPIANTLCSQLSWSQYRICRHRVENAQADPSGLRTAATLRQLLRPV